MLPNYYRYMAIFTYEEDGVHVVFPDLPGCVTFGKDEEEAARMAREVLALHLYGMEEDSEEIPQPSSLRVLAEQEDLQDNEAFLLVESFMPAFREKQRTRFVKKTLSIPYWMNAEAERIGVNFSQTLQNALEEKIALAK
ncbi:type II toxin-antitoxin system HicB family antitoxin [uncultured Selenomonas sp.]|uniref:type II toxin-antitoxin system HicB family antitoxin n=1 Tax=uncultured Selenomonas sp. TaxID=159275 RepID=UPI0028D4FFD8|nr:type II toxin-antitoxin system HicB family antitoxin [uncultured Selenomonas sp.]